MLKSKSTARCFCLFMFAIEVASILVVYGTDARPQAQLLPFIRGVCPVESSTNSLLNAHQVEAPSAEQ